MELVSVFVLDGNKQVSTFLAWFFFDSGSFAILTYILSSNVPEIVPYILQFFLKIPMPLSVIQILSIDLGSDMLPGLALGSEKPEKNIMKRPPVGSSEKILDWEVYNEPNIFFWQGPRDMYAELLTRAYASIKAANPQARVLGCSTAVIDLGSFAGPSHCRRRSTH